MRILYCNKYNFPFSGTEAYLFSAMELMRSQGHQVALFSMADERGDRTAFDEFFLPHIDFKQPTHGTFEKARLAAHAIYSREARCRLRKMIVAFRPDVAHVRNIYHHLSPSILWELRAQGVPVLYHLNDFKLLCPSYNMVSHGHACEHCRGGEFWRVLTEGCYPGPLGSGLLLAAEAYFHKWMHTYQKCVDLFLAPSRFVKERLVLNGWDEDRIEVLPHFQRTHETTRKPSAEAPILYFGRLSPEKGVTDLLRAMKRLPSVRLKIAGDGPQRTELENLAGELSLANVEFVGHLGGSSLYDQIAASQFTVLPSRAYETLGKTILESYAVGRSVIASDLGSRRELVEEGQTGLLYRPGDIEQLAGAISFLHHRPALALQMGAAGREMVRARYNPEDHYAALSLLYQRLVETRPTSKAPALATKPRLRVAFIGGRGVVSKYSGIEAYYEEIGSRLAAMGHDITVYCRNYFTPPLKTYEGMRIVRLPTIRTKHWETVIHTFLSTLHAIGSGCDIVHFHALGPALFSFIPRIFGKKTVVTVQGLDWQRKKWRRIASTVLHLGEKAAIRFPTRTMVVSRTLEQYYLGLYKAPTTYIPNGTVIRERRPPRYLAKWGLRPDQYILFLGRFSPEKNCHLLMQAFERINTSVKLVMAGGSSYSSSYENELRQHAGERVSLLDYVSGEALEELLSNAVLFVLPSDLEGLSLALLDAMGAGVCVLTSDIAENRELVDHGGFTFLRGDVHDLERMMRLLLSEDRVRKDAALQGQDYVRQNFLWPQIAEQIERAYFDVLGLKRPSSAESSYASPSVSSEERNRVA